MWPLLMMHWSSVQEPRLPPPLYTNTPSLSPNPLCSVTPALVVTPGGQGWKPVQTCSFVDPPTGTNI